MDNNVIDGAAIRSQFTVSMSGYSLKPLLVVKLSQDKAQLSWQVHFAMEMLPVER